MGDEEAEATDMTNEEFRRMPLLLTRAEFIRATGISSRRLTAMVKSGEVKPWFPPRVGPRKSKYRKADAAKCIGLIC